MDVIDTRHNTVLDTIIIVGNRPVGVGVDTVLHRAYITNSQDGTVSVLDLTPSHHLGPPIRVGSNPVAVGVGS